MIDDGCEVRRTIQLDRIQGSVVRLQDAIDALTIRVAGVSVLANTVTTDFSAFAIDLSPAKRQKTQKAKQQMVEYPER